METFRWHAYLVGPAYISTPAHRDVTDDAAEAVKRECRRKLLEIAKATFPDHRSSRQSSDAVSCSYNRGFHSSTVAIAPPHVM